MKNRFTSVLLAAIAIAFVLCLSLGFIASSAYAETATVTSSDATVSAIADTAAAVATPWIVSLALAHPWIITVLTVMGTFRFFFKPLFSAVQAYVKSTATTKDDEILVKIEASMPYKIFAWLIDYLGSIKIPTTTVVKGSAETTTGSNAA